MTFSKQLTTLETPNKPTDSGVGEPVQGVLLEQGVVCDLSAQALNRDVHTTTVRTTPRTYVYNAQSVHLEESKDGIELVALEASVALPPSTNSAPYSVNCVLLEAGSGKRLSKQISLSATDSITTKRCSFGVSKAAPREFETLKGFGEFVDRLQPNQAISIGSLVPGVQLVNGFARVQGKNYVNSSPNSISRSLRFFQFRAQQSGLMLIDVDLKGITSVVAERIAMAGGVWNLFCAIWPELQSAGYLQRGSTSSGIFNALSGQEYPGTGGVHIYLVVEDQSDVPRALRAMQRQLGTLDLNWTLLTKDGKRRVGCLADVMVGSPERVIFEGAPEVVPPLQQRPRASAFAGGDIVDTLAVFKDIVLEVSTQGPTDAAIAPIVTNEDGSEGMEKPVTERSATALLAHQVDQERMISQIRRAHHFDQLPHDATLALCYNRGASMRTEFWQFGEIQQMVSWIAARGCSFNYYLGENTFRPDSKKRFNKNVGWLNSIFVDIDLSHPPPGFDLAMLPDSAISHVDLGNILVRQLSNAGLPLPTLIISSGGGIHLKWIFSSAVHISKVRVWQALQTRISAMIAALKFDQGSLAWPIDTGVAMAAQIMRLAGTLNGERNSVCDILIDTNKTIPFEELCQGTLVTASDSVGFKRLGYSATPQELDENRNLAQARGIRLKRPLKNVNVPGEFSSKTVTDADRRLWTYRLAFLEAIARHRGGVEEGCRNHFFWRISLCLAWVSTSNDEFEARLLDSFNTHFATNWTWPEALSTCSTVITRRTTGNLYRLVNARIFEDSLCISAEEQQLFSHLLHGPGKNSKRGSWRTGSMNFEPIPGGSDFSTFEKEVRRRQALAGARSAQTRKSNHTPETIAQAHQLTAFGLSRKDIILELGVSRSTLNRWLCIENSGEKSKERWKNVGPSKPQTQKTQSRSMFEFVMQFEYANRELFSRGLPISYGSAYLDWMAAREAQSKSTLN